MVKNVVDDGVEPKLPIIEASVEPKPTSVSKLRDNELNTTSLFFTKDRWRVRDSLLDWVHRQVAKA